MMEGSEILQNDDIVCSLSKMGMNETTDKIFQQMDALTLCRAEEVSVGWAKIIEDGKFWEKLFKKNVFQSHDWKVLQNSLLSNVKGDIIDHHEYKKACLLIASKQEEIKENWKSGAMIERKCDIVSPCDAYGDYFGWLFNTYRPTYNRSFALNSQWAVTAGTDSKVTIRNRFKLNEIIGKLDIPISNDSGGHPLISTVLANERFIVCSFYFNCEVIVWDVATQQLLFVLDGGSCGENWDRLRSSLNNICLYEDSLLTMHGGREDVTCTMYKLSNDPKATPSKSFVKKLSVKAISTVYMDESLISMHVCLKNLTFGSMDLDLNPRIFTRSAATFDAISDIDAKSVTNFHYHGGVIAVAEESGKTIRLLDPETQVCRRIVGNSLEPYSPVVDLKIVRDKLLACDDEGRVKIWDLEKILNSDDKDSYFLCCTREPNPPMSRMGVCAFEKMFMDADEFQIGLISTFTPNEHSLYVIDFIGDWDEKKE